MRHNVAMASATLGFKAHSGWAALVAVGGSAESPQIVKRQHVEVVAPANATWAKQPYHAADGLDPGEAEELVRRGIESAQELAHRELCAVVAQCRTQGHEIVGCGVLLGERMPEWSVREILAVHMRMHLAEGVLFRDVWVRASEKCGLPVTGVHERKLWENAEKVLGASADALRKRLGEMGKAVGAPWGKDQKEAALIAWLALASAEGT